jgi:hypothetical protein
LIEGNASEAETRNWEMSERLKRELIVERGCEVREEVTGRKGRTVNA